MFKTLQNAWKIPELRKKLIFTMMILLIYRLGSVIPLPYQRFRIPGQDHKIEIAFNASQTETHFSTICAPSPVSDLPLILLHCGYNHNMVFSEYHI